MKYAVVYCSHTGNTKKVANMIATVLDANQVVYIGEADSENVKEADVVFAGFWTDKGTCSKEFIEFLSHTHGKQIALFGTCGFGGSEEYFDVILQRVSAFVEDDCTYVDGFMCQGKMDQSVRERYITMMNSNDDKAKFQSMIDNFDHAVTHPDEDDLRHAKAFAQIIVRSCE